MPKPKKLLNNAELFFLRAAWPLFPREETRRLFNRVCRRRLTAEQLWGLANRHGFGPAGGGDGRFRKGSVPHNKGRKGYAAPGCEKGWFAKGHRGSDRRRKPMFSERVSVQKGKPILWIKCPGPSSAPSHRRLNIHQRDHWTPKARWVWAQAHGAVPKGHVIVHLDGDPLNCDLSNLDCVHRRILMRLNSKWSPGYAGPAMNPSRVRLAQVSDNLARIGAEVAHA